MSSRDLLEGARGSSELVPTAGVLLTGLHQHTRAFNGRPRTRWAKGCALRCGLPTAGALPQALCIVLYCTLILISRMCARRILYVKRVHLHPFSFQLSVFRTRALEACRCVIGRGATPQHLPQHLPICCYNPTTTPDMRTWCVLSLWRDLGRSQPTGRNTAVCWFPCPHAPLAFAPRAPRHCQVCVL